ncbi:hypothetical protein ACFY2R_28980 [Micromonospora olivasterospora]|uniref:hypothetical protein n=1 Tax=Micromonospora olivasterospora TaxID=1880 RepID=UPI001B86005F|nr:hypothetical protein [Micromonospora olivasterospora]
MRNTTDLRTEYRLAAMNQSLGVPTVFLPAQPELAAMSSTAVRTLGSDLRPRSHGLPDIGEPLVGPPVG